MFCLLVGDSEDDEEELDSEGEVGEDDDVSPRSSDRRYPSRTTRLTRNSAAGERRRKGKSCSALKLVCFFFVLFRHHSELLIFQKAEQK